MLSPNTLILLFLVFWIGTLFDCILNKKITSLQKLLWSLLILFTNYIGAIIYLLVNRILPILQRQKFPQGEQQPEHLYYSQGYSMQPMQRDETSSPESEQQIQSDDYEQPKAYYPTQQQD